MLQSGGCTCLPCRPLKKWFCNVAPAGLTRTSAIRPTGVRICPVAGPGRHGRSRWTSGSGRGSCGAPLVRHVRRANRRGVDDRPTHQGRTRGLCRFDCGVAIDPDVIRAQRDGGIGFALGALCYSEIDIRQGRAVDRNFVTCKSLRIQEMPVVEVHIVERTTRSRRRALASRTYRRWRAVANAIAKLGAARVRRLPFSRAGLVSA